MYPKWISEISFVSTADQKEKSSENEKEKEKSNDKHNVFIRIPFRKGKNERKNHKAKEKTISAYRIKSMSWGNIKTVDGSVSS